MSILDSIVYYGFLAYLLKCVLAYASKFVKIDGAKRHVLITGVDSGFGRLAALRLQRAGVHVIGTCLTDAGKASMEADAAKSGAPGT